MLCISASNDGSGFFQSVIANSATIDATTREHVAFVVFCGDKSSIVEPGDRLGYGYRGVKFRLNGLSISNDPWAHADSNFRRSATTLERAKSLFSAEWAQRMRFSPDDVNDHLLSYHMSRVGTKLIELFDIDEALLPCLVFSDGLNPARKVIVRLDQRDPLGSLYLHVLKPLSNEFSRLAKCWDGQFVLEQRRRTAARAADMVNSLPAEIESLKAKIVKERESADCELRPLRAKLEALEIARSSYRRGADVERLSAELESIRAGKREFRSEGHKDLETAMVAKRLWRAEQRLRSELAVSNRELLKSIDGVRSQIETRVSSVRELEDQLIETSRRLETSKRDLADHPPESIPHSEKELRYLRRRLLRRGYEKAVLTTRKPSAYLAIECMFRLGLLGFNSPPILARPEPMRILFLAANPSCTSQLDLEEELRSLEFKLRGVKHRDRITLIARLAVRPDGLVRTCDLTSLP